MSCNGDEEPKFVELDGNATSYGIKQSIANVKAGSYLLAWKHTGRNNPKAEADPYRVRIYYLNGTTEISINQSAVFSGYDKMHWSDSTYTFQITDAQLTAAGTNAIYVAFIPTGNLNTYGTLIDKVNLLPIEFVTPAGDPVNAPVDAGTVPANIPDGANEFTFSAATTGVLTVKLRAKAPGIGSMSASVQADFTFEVDTVGSSSFVWDAANPGGKATVSGDFVTATAIYTGLPQNHTDFGLKKARVKHNGNNAGEAKFEVFFTKDSMNHPSSSSSDVVWPNWYYYWKNTSANFGTHQWTINNLAYTSNTGTGWKCYIGKDSSLLLGAWGNSNGIDTFANVCRHEDTHKKQLSAMWGEFSSIDTTKDTDSDNLKDSMEANLIPGYAYDNTKKGFFVVNA